jgi:hypothetical protein
MKDNLKGLITALLAVASMKWFDRLFAEKELDAFHKAATNAAH